MTSPETAGNTARLAERLADGAAARSGRARQPEAGVDLNPSEACQVGGVDGSISSAVPVRPGSGAGPAALAPSTAKPGQLGDTEAGRHCLSLGAVQHEVQADLVSSTQIVTVLPSSAETARYLCSAPPHERECQASSGATRSSIQQDSTSCHGSPCEEFLYVFKSGRTAAGAPGAKAAGPSAQPLSGRHGRAWALTCRSPAKTRSLPRGSQWSVSAETRSRPSRRPARAAAAYGAALRPQGCSASPQATAASGRP
jgi:hypothetical protein